MFPWSSKRWLCHYFHYLTPRGALSLTHDIHWTGTIYPLLGTFCRYLWAPCRLIKIGLRYDSHFATEISEIRTLNLLYACEYELYCIKNWISEINTKCRKINSTFGTHPRFRPKRSTWGVSFIRSVRPRIGKL